MAVVDHEAKGEAIDAAAAAAVVVKVAAAAVAW